MAFFVLCGFILAENAWYTDFDNISCINTDKKLNTANLRKTTRNYRALKKNFFSPSLGATNEKKI